MRGHKSIIILGGALQALQLLGRLRDHDLLLLEGSSRCGGWIHTIEKEGFLFELGPRSCRTYGNGTATLKLIDELGLRKDLLPASPSAQVRYLLLNQRLIKLPASFIEFVKSPFFMTLLPLY